MRYLEPIFGTASDFKSNMVAELVNFCEQNYLTEEQFDNVMQLDNRVPQSEDWQRDHESMTGQLFSTISQKLFALAIILKRRRSRA